MSRDRTYMKRALQLAGQGLFTTGANPRVGCVIVKNNTVIGEGFHHRTGGPHAEVNALASASEPVEGATAYVSLEPCCHHGLTPPCTESLIGAKLRKVVICNLDPNPVVAGQGVRALRDAGIILRHGLLAKKGEALNRGFFLRMRTGLPLVRLKLAQSLDGRTAMANGESYWITGGKARQDVQYWRARSTAILTGIGTVLHDDCRMSVRGGELPEKYRKLPNDFDSFQPMRVILDTALRIPADAKILQSVGRRVVMTLAGDCAKSVMLEKQGVEIVKMPPGPDGRPDIKAVLQWLGQQQINEVLVESGAVLAGQFVAQNLVDELLVYTAPVIMGRSARPLLDLRFETMKQRLLLKNVKLKKLGKDWRIRAGL